MKREAWRAQLEAQERSGLSATEYCGMNNLSVSAFSYWKNELSKKFVQGSGGAPFEIIL